MSGPAYPAVRAVAPKVVPHFAHDADEACTVDAIAGLTPVDGATGC